MTKSLLAEAAVNLRKQGVFTGMAADAQIGAVRFREPGAFETFPRTSLEVIDGRKIAESGDIVLEEFEGFAAPEPAGASCGAGGGCARSRLT